MKATGRTCVLPVVVLRLLLDLRAGGGGGWRGGWRRCGKWLACAGNCGGLETVGPEGCMLLGRRCVAIRGCRVRALANRRGPSPVGRASGCRASLTQLLTQAGCNFTWWTNLSAIDISGDGRTIAGNGTNPPGAGAGVSGDGAGAGGCGCRSAWGVVMLRRRRGGTR
jgi:hypothetical protein